MPGGRGGEVGVAGRGGPYRADQLRRGGVLEQEARAPSRQGPQHVLLLSERRQDQHPRVGPGPAQFGQGGQPVHDRHLDVQQDDVRAVRPGQLHRVAAVPRLRDDVDVVGGVEDHPDTGSDERFVIGDEDPDHDSPAGLGGRSGGRLSGHHLRPGRPAGAGAGRGGGPVRSRT